MVNNKSSSRKTIRIDKQLFIFMTILTPVFASIVAIVLVLAVFFPLIGKNQLEVPILGGIEEVADGSSKEITLIENQDTTTTEQPTTTEPSKNNPSEEIIIKTEIPALSTKIEEKTTLKSFNNSQKTQKSTKNAPATQNLSTENLNSQSTKGSTSPESLKPVEKSAKELCEEKINPYTTLIKVDFFTPIEVPIVALFSGIENPVASYEKYILKSGATAKMIYKNNSCNPSEENFEKIDDKILTEEELGTYGITAKTSYFDWR